MLENNNAAANATETQIDWKSLHTSGCSHRCAFVDLKCGRGNAILKPVNITYRSNSLPTCIPRNSSATFRSNSAHHCQ